MPAEGTRRATTSFVWYGRTMAVYEEHPKSLKRGVNNASLL
jgi:hypothetical protein